MPSSKFHGGPADGQEMALRRCPLYLRVTFRKRADGLLVDFDVLNYLDDQPEKDEILVVYRLTGPANRIHLLIRWKNRKNGGWWQTGEYAVNPEQPSEAVIRNNEKWRAWCEGQPLEYLK